MSGIWDLTTATGSPDNFRIATTGVFGFIAMRSVCARVPSDRGIPCASNAFSRSLTFSAFAAAWAAGAMPTKADNTNTLAMSMANSRDKILSSSESSPNSDATAFAECNNTFSQVPGAASPLFSK